MSVGQVRWLIVQRNHRRPGVRPMPPLWERCLPAKNDNAVYLQNRVAYIAGKRAPTDG
jgi:hypothetical protein